MNNDEKLIELVKTRRAIYDKTDIFYSNKDYVKELWQEISKEMNQTVPVCQKRWRYLRDYFVRQLHMTQNQQNIEQRKLQNDTTSSLSLHSMITSLSDTSVISNTNNNNNNSSIKNNNNVSTTIPIVTQKKKTFWAFYDKMLFLKPFSSTRKSRPKNSNSRRQSQGYINKKSIISLQSLSNDNNDHNDTVHTLSDSNSIDDEFDSFDYMTMYQMQFGTEADKAELQINGANYHSNCMNTDDHIDQQTISNNQQIAQIPSNNNSSNNSISNNNNEQGSVIPTLITQDTDFMRIQQHQEKESHQNLQQGFRKSISNSTFTESIARSNNEFTSVSVNANNISLLPSMSSLPPLSSKTIEQKQQQQSRENLPNLPATALSSPSSSSSSSLLTQTHFESQRKQRQQNRKQKQQYQQKPPAKKRKRSEICEEILKILKRSDADNDLERNDEHAMFFKSLLNSVRKIDEEHISAFRTEILQIIMKYRYMSQSDKSSSSSDVVVVDTGEMHWRHKLPF